MEIRRYGVTSGGDEVAQYTLRGDGIVVRFLSYGGIITDIEVPDRAGVAANVVLGLPTLGDYEAKNGRYYFGGIVGRYAGRIAGARFALDGEEVRLHANEGSNAVHGGRGESFIAKLWEVEPLEDLDGGGALLRYTSSDGEQGFPGRMHLEVAYRLGLGCQLRIDYAARTDRSTVLNLTNHSYFNLAAGGVGSVLDHSLQLFADRLIATDDAGIPDGKFPPVAGSAFDFRQPRRIGERLDEAQPRILGQCGYNHSWLIDSVAGRLSPAARLMDPGSGRALEVLTTEPSVHVYTANHFAGEDVGAGGAPLVRHAAVALETQHLPDSPNRPEFPSTLLRPGETFHSTTIYRFETA
ncbi:MAG TPA: aldose epimerase family protein [Allosphingosinicella sp.]|nr:aldose epimerase family protein [Allosphingosinicella sp.]